MSKPIMSRDYISSKSCLRFAEICKSRYSRLMDIQEQLLFQSLEKICIQSAKYAEAAESEDDAPCPACGSTPQFDGMWHTPECFYYRKQP